MIYPYKCPGCGATKDVWQRLSEYIAAPIIPRHCGVPSQRVFTVPMVAPDYQSSFVSHIDGTVISSRSQQREHMAKHGVVLYDEIAPDLPRMRASCIEAQFADLKDDINVAIDKVVQGYVPPQQMVDGSVEDIEGIDVLATDALPKELKSDALVEV